MRADVRKSDWRRWREAAFATCTAWLVVQNLGLLVLVTSGGPADPTAASESIARSAFAWGGALLAVFVVAVTGLALAAWLVHAPKMDARDSRREVAGGR